MAALAVALGGCTSATQGGSADPASPTTAAGSPDPWEVALAGEAFVITEVAGTIAMVDGDGLRRFEVETSAPVAHDGGSGLLGLALAEDFEDSGNAYVYYTYAAGGGLANRVA